MTPSEFRDIRDCAGLSSKAIAAMFEIDDRLVRRWAAGTVAIPQEMAAWLTEYAALWAARPVPAPAWFAPVREAG